jgi:hypothetical protein
MSKSVTSRPFGGQFLGNKHKKEVHKLSQEKTNCQVDEFIRAGHAVVFEPDTLPTAQQEGYDNCAWCIGNSLR